MLHPVFFGSLDWHSSVHTHWLLASVLRLFPKISEADAICDRFEEAFVGPAIAGEAAFLARPSSAGFERPYGWAWLLMLAAELVRHEGLQARRWTEALHPLVAMVADRFTVWLPKADFPVRAGVHANTAFALALTWEYAAIAGDEDLAQLVRRKALSWYADDASCQAWEPSGDDFLSPALVEAELMRRVLPGGAFAPWFARFLPDAAVGLPATLFTPVQVSDRSDGKIAHLDGLNLSRAWCWRAIASGLVGADPARGRAVTAASRHLEAALPHLADDYMGEHWLASFALLALMTEGP